MYLVHFGRSRYEHIFQQQMISSDVVIDSQTNVICDGLSKIEISYISLFVIWLFGLLLNSSFLPY